MRLLVAAVPDGSDREGVQRQWHVQLRGVHVHAALHGRQLRVQQCAALPGQLHGRKPRLVPVRGVQLPGGMVGPRLRVLGAAVHDELWRRVAGHVRVRGVPVPAWL